MAVDKGYNRYVLHTTDSISDAVSLIDENQMQIVVILDDNDIVVGVITDGDIRRGIIHRVDFSLPVSHLMSSNPITARKGTHPTIIMRMMKDNIVHQIPIVDEENRLIGVVSFNDVLKELQINTTIVLMAGGLGTRLGDITVHTPKPLIEVGEKPILVSIIESFARQGFYDFYLSVNYKADMIEEYLGNGSSLGVSIKYLKESFRMGTIGALSLLPQDIEYPIIVMNGDILTTVDFKKMIGYHVEQQGIATMGVKNYVNEIPYGVVMADESDYVSELVEKPQNSYLVNAGIYVFEREAVDMIPEMKRFDVTQLFDSMISAGKKIKVYRLDDYWIDIGRTDDLYRAQREYVLLEKGIE